MKNMSNFKIELLIEPYITLRYGNLIFLLEKGVFVSLGFDIDISLIRVKILWLCQLDFP